MSGLTVVPHGVGSIVHRVHRCENRRGGVCATFVWRSVGLVRCSFPYQRRRLLVPDAG